METGNQSKSIEDILGRHENQPGFVMGLGPGLSPYIQHIPKMKDNNFVLLSTNNWYKIFSHRIDYWILANNVCRIEKHYKIMNDFNKPVFYADTVDLTSKEFIQKNLTCEYLAYNERNHYDPNRPSINKELMDFSEHHEMYQSSGTVALHMLAFALLMKCNPIYIAGLNLDYKGRQDCYAVGDKGVFTNPHGDKMGFEISRDNIIKSFAILNDTADTMGIELVNLSGNHPGLNFIKSGEIKYGN